MKRQKIVSNSRVDLGKSSISKGKQIKYQYHCEQYLLISTRIMFLTHQLRSCCRDLDENR